MLRGLDTWYLAVQQQSFTGKRHARVSAALIPWSLADKYQLRFAFEMIPQSLQPRLWSILRTVMNAAVGVRVVQPVLSAWKRRYEAVG